MSTVILEDKVSLQGQVSGTFVDISVGSTNLVATLSVSSDRTLTVNNLAATFNSITASSQLDQYAKVSVTATDTKLTIQVQFSLTVSGVTVYQIVKVTISNIYTTGYVSVPIADIYAPYKMGSADPLLTLVVTLGLSIYFAVKNLRGYGMKLN